VNATIEQSAPSAVDDPHSALGELLTEAERMWAAGDERSRTSAFEALRGRMANLVEAEGGPLPPASVRNTALADHFRSTLASAGITSGRVAEIGGARNSACAELPEFEFTFLSLFKDKEPCGRDIRVADIAYCPHIPDETFDVVFSISVLEHVDRPWAAASEMTRILKPGGVVYHQAPFSDFFHRAPNDYWRFTPEAMKVLFPRFETICADFYGQGRRRDRRGTAFNPLDQGGPQFAVDAFGGWRENWQDRVPPRGVRAALSFRSPARPAGIIRRPRLAA